MKSDWMNIWIPSWIWIGRSTTYGHSFKVHLKDRIIWAHRHASSVRHKFIGNKKVRCVFSLNYARENYVVVIYIVSFISVGLILLVLGSNWYILAIYAFCLLVFGFYYRRRIYSRSQHQSKGKQQLN